MAGGCQRRRIKGGHRKIWRRTVCSQDCKSDCYGPRIQAVAHYARPCRARRRCRPHERKRSTPGYKDLPGDKIGRASGRERVGKYVLISVVAGSLKKKKRERKNYKK